MPGAIAVAAILRHIKLVANVRGIPKRAPSFLSVEPVNLGAIAELPILHLPVRTVSFAIVIPDTST